MKSRFDTRTFLLMVGAALVGVAWANYNYGLTGGRPYPEEEFRSLVWTIFATPFALFLGWLLARPAEHWWAAFVCFCIYFFAPFIAARYESCVVLTNSFDLNSCFVATTAAQQAANDRGHSIYFQAVVVVHALAALAVALQRARSRSTMPVQTPQPQQAPT